MFYFSSVDIKTQKLSLSKKRTIIKTEPQEYQHVNVEFFIIAKQQNVIKSDSFVSYLRYIDKTISTIKTMTMECIQCGNVFVDKVVIKTLSSCGKKLKSSINADSSERKKR